MSARKRRAPPVEEEVDEADDEYGDDDAVGTVPGACLDAVVKLFVTHTEPNYSLPWQMRRQTSSTSSGFAISGKRILTNAHCVDNVAVVKVKKRGSATKYVAEVLAIGRECDLAVLSVEDKEFWKGIKPITLAERLPALQDEVTVVGFPVGGDNLAITQGVVSRIDMQEYVHGCCELLAVQIDAAINPGNSGGPAFGSDNECVGIAFQSLKDGQTENIGYIIPTEVANHFLTDVSRGAYSGFVELGLELQKCENPSLRAHLGLKAAQSGLLVKLVAPAAGAFAADVRRGDVLTHIDGVALANDGTVPFRAGGGRISFTYLLSQKFVSDSTAVKLLRGGQSITKQVTLKVQQLLVPEASAHRKAGLACPDLRLPSYVIVGGLVFCALCEPYLRSEYGEQFDEKAPLKLLDQWQYGVKQAADAQVVVLSQVLAHPSNVGYETLTNHLVTRVNGEKVTSLLQMLRIVDANSQPYVQFDLEPHDECVVLDAKTLTAVNAELLQQHQIPADRSADLRRAAGGAGSSSGHEANGAAPDAKKQRKRAR